MVGCAGAPTPARSEPPEDAPPPRVTRSDVPPEIEAQPLPASMPEPARTYWARALELGWPDPRAGLPHRVVVGGSTVWSTELETFEAVGFVIPAAPTWAVYGETLTPLESTGEPLDLVESCRATLQALDAIGPLPHQHDPDSHGYADRFFSSEEAWDGCPGISAVLYLAEAEPALAAALSEHLFGDYHRADDEAANALVGTVAAAFETAVTAHMRGDDRVARVEARRVADALPRLREWLEAAGVSFQRYEYLRVAIGLAADQDRRATATPHPPLPEIPTEGEVPPELVPALVAHLDEVQQTQMGQPGGVALHMHPLVDALVRAGEAAVPDLLDAFESDDRLTRSVHFWRDFAPPRTVLAVHEAAYAALIRILGASFFSPAATGDNLTSRGDASREEMARAMRAYWERYGGATPPQRRYLVIADDDASRAQQVEAAQWLATPEGGYAPQGSMVFTSWVEGPPGALSGEPVRDDREPSVTALLTRRMNQSEAGHQSMGQGCGFASALAAWEPARAAELSVDFARRCVDDGECGCAPGLVLLTGEREPGLVAAYATRLRGLEHVDAYQLTPIARFADHPAIRRAVRVLFREGALGPAQRVGNLASYLRALVEARAHEAAPVRAELLRQLRDTSTVGTYERRGDGGWVEYARGGFSVPTPEGSVDGPHPVRRADVVASGLAEALEVTFSVGWALDRRDAAIAAMRERLDGGR